MSLDSIKIKGVSEKDKFDLVCDGYFFWLVENGVYKSAHTTIEHAVAYNDRCLTNYNIYDVQARQTMLF